jgi:hypothetical protein
VISFTPSSDLLPELGKVAAPKTAVSNGAVGADCAMPLIALRLLFRPADGPS